MDDIQKTEQLDKKRASLQRHEAIVKRLRSKEPFTTFDKKKLNREKYMVRKIRKAISNIEKISMVTEDYVSFETAKLLKEKGFDEGCRQYWYKGNIVFSRSEIRNGELDNYEDEGWTAPTLQMAMKWLREKHRIFLNVSYIPEHFAFTYRVISPSGETKFVTYVDAYEQACEVAIKYCLEKLI